MANCCTNGLNQVFCNAFNKYYNTLYTNGEISKEETNNLLIIDYVRQCLSDDRYNSYYSILLKALRCIANNSCLLDTSWLYDRSIVPKVTNLFVTVLTKQAFVETDPIFRASPAATITDEDINNWNNPSTSGGLFSINVEYHEGAAEPYTIDETWDEIIDAYTNNQILVLNYDNNIYQLTHKSSNTLLFTAIDGESVALDCFEISTDGLGTYCDHLYATELQERLISGTSIKTINSSSILGSGNVDLLTPNFCPIIEDTRSAVVAAITGNAPFSSLVNGQRIILHFNRNGKDSPTLNLQKSGGGWTGAIPIRGSSQNVGEGAVFSSVYAGSYLELVYDEYLNKWLTIGQLDSNTTYDSNTQAQITAGTDTEGRLISPKLLRDNFYIKNEVDNICPIIEDTRSQTTDVNITGTAPFATLAGGLRIVLHFKYANAASPTLQLTLSGGTTTSAYPLYQNYNNGVNALTLQAMPAGSYGEFVFDSTNSRWVLVGKDYNTTYSNTSQADINSAAQGSRLIEPKLIHDNAYIVSLAYTSGSLKANKFYDFGTVSTALTIPSLDATNDLVSNALNFYALRFIAGADNLSITFPTGVVVDDTPTINTGDYVEIMINKYGNNFYASIKVWQAQ